MLSPRGGRVHAAWGSRSPPGSATSTTSRPTRSGRTTGSWSTSRRRRAAAVRHDLIEPDELEDLVVGELSGSALFGSRFRENAARALLLPRAYPGKRTLLWQQRLKSQSLLEVARDFRASRSCSRPTASACGTLDLPALERLLRDLASRRISLVEVETSTASPFASSLLFDYVATYMYEGDTPNAERAPPRSRSTASCSASCSVRTSSAS